MNEHCDPETGICKPSTLEELGEIGTNANINKTEIIYIGDPMCSWCWGISPALIQLRNYFAKDNVPFRIVVGGLRPGGGDPWNDKMKDFLRHHWEQVNERSGQPFGYALMDLEEFNYDTEPACRAVVAARPLLNGDLMEFFESIQRHFYVNSQDPNEITFYEEICKEHQVDFNDFKSRFESDEVKMETKDEFNLNRKWGIQGYPAVALLHNDKLYSVARGFATFEEMKNQVEYLI